jgi:hypothetical protein
MVLGIELGRGVTLTTSPPYVSGMSRYNVGSSKSHNTMGSTWTVTKIGFNNNNIEVEIAIPKLKKL